MRAESIQVIGGALAFKWTDGAESFVELPALRRACPCASCRGETDVMGVLHKGPEKPLSQRSFEIVRLAEVGTYGLQVYWADGHSTGIFSLDQIRKLSEAD